MHEVRSLRSGWLLVAASLCAAIGCAEEDASVGGAKTTTDASAATAVTGPDAGSALPKGCPVLVNDKDCDKSLRPIVFVHGTVANGDSFAHPAKILASNGYCPEWIRAVEYHSLVAAVPDAAAAAPQGLDGGVALADGGVADAAAPAFVLDRVEAFRRASADIDRVIAELQRDTGFDKVDLAGHSQGSGHGSTYAGMNPGKVAHYVHLAGGQLEQDPGGVPTLCLSSIGDRPVTCKTTKNITFQDQTLDHSAVASSTEAALEVYRFLTGKEPKYQDIQCGDPITIEGRAPTFADNTFLVGAKVELYELDYSKAPRERGAPVSSTTITADGKFGPWQVKRDVPYEFRLVPPANDSTRRPSHAYLQPFKRTDRLLRFNFETKDPVASATSSQVNRDASFSIVIPRSRQRAFYYKTDSLKVNGFEVIKEDTTWNATTNRSRVTVAYYLFDKSLTPGTYGPGDGKSTGESIISGSFVNSADLFVPTTPAAWVDVTFNGTTLKVPNWVSGVDGASVVFVN